MEDPAMRFRLRLLALAGLLLAVPVQAQNFSPMTVFTFSTLSQPKDVIDDPNVDGFSKNPDLRPNTASELNLYAFNPSKVEKSYTVEMTLGRGRPLTSRVTIPGEKWARVKFKPVAPAAPAPAAVPAPAAGSAPVAPADPVPPGVPVAIGKDGKFPITLRLLTGDLEPKPVQDKNGFDYGLEAKVSILQPKDYVTVTPKLTRPTQADQPTRILVEVAATTKLVGTASLKLGIPLQSVASKAVLRNGFYERTLTREATATALPKATLQGAVEAAGEIIRVQVGVDGVDRAFVYTTKAAGTSTDSNLITLQDPAVRVTTAIGPSIQESAQPAAAFPVRVETDSAPLGSKLELWLRPEGAGDSASENEIVQLGGPRNERLWVDPVGPDEGLLFTVKSTDWVHSIDMRPLRGKTEIVGVLRNSNGVEIARSVAFRLTVDTTAPDKIVFNRLPAKHIKGKPLPVRVTTSDPETTIQKVVFFLGKPGEDGKMPPEAPKIPAERQESLGLFVTNDWLGALPLPADKKGEIFITAQVTNQAGLTSLQTQKVELVDPPPPLGTIEGKVTLGERAQPKLSVKLADAEGKLKGTATTDDAGKFKFEKLPPGKYTVSAARPDSVSETKGTAEAIVEADKTAKANITLARPK
jgi:hypothetical protein